MKEEKFLGWNMFPKLVPDTKKEWYARSAPSKQQGCAAAQ